MHFASGWDAREVALARVSPRRYQHFVVHSEGCTHHMPAARELLTVSLRGFGVLPETGGAKARKIFHFQHAGVAELVDARDLKSEHQCIINNLRKTPN